jgi:hypothetical protein
MPATRAGEKVSNASHKAAPTPEYIFGTVKETMNSGGYTYMLLANSGEETWVAIPATSVKEGMEVMVKPGAPMHNFHSNTLDRTFSTIIFSPGIVDDNSHGAPVAKLPAPPSPAEMKKHKGRRMLPMVKGITVTDLPEGAVTVADLYARADAFDNRSVTIKARVVKVSPRIMGKNWIHLQDGSGSEEKKDYDITVTTMDMPSVGDTVTVTGTAHSNRDFGAGYKYDMIVEDARVTVEAGEK